MGKGNLYVCRHCAYASVTRYGKCPQCGQWDSMEAKVQAAPASARRGAREPALALADIIASGEERFSSGNNALDRVLGGGWVRGSVAILGGEPGIGKSTLILQVAARVGASGGKVLYVCGEESPEQVKLRANRLGVEQGIFLTRETSAEEIALQAVELGARLLVVDSIQTIRAAPDAVPGTITQVRESTQWLTRAAKEHGITIVLIGHVTKEGALAGPKAVEHIVDVTLSLEGSTHYRVLRSTKNRFGPTGELGVFEMTEVGMAEVENPSEFFLAERCLLPGSAVVSCIEGRSPLLLEVQALLAKSPYPVPKRVSNGLDPRRVDLILAVLERRLGLPVAGLDVYVSLTGGIKVYEPAADLGVAAAVLSAVQDRPLPADLVVVGEIGLTGELRRVPHLEQRRREAERLGYRRLVSPEAARTLSEAARLFF